MRQLIITLSLLAASSPVLADIRPPAPIPLPASLWLFGSAAVLLVTLFRKRK